ncbi:hypothetical protein ARMGADRAFT_1036874 [Armillaria gallica]|uniref:F-box domain-containing protein n=1 Tax=Armillaria gallica TaxID=47427 RepID=A0A2H3DAX5_ARMGA|nr:hypothetical protein ARMGADRAFT_1036874 [Armillaria gallica]
MWLSALLSMEVSMQRVLALLIAHSTTWKDVEFAMSSYKSYNKVISAFFDSPILVHLPLLETLHVSILGTLPENASENISDDTSEEASDKSSEEDSEDSSEEASEADSKESSEGEGGSEEASEDGSASDDASEPDQHSITTFANAPKLCSVIMDPFLPIRLPWPQITHLCTSGISPVQLLDTFHVAVHLEAFTMSDAYKISRGSSSIPVTSNTIKMLKLYDTGFLPYLTLPSLTYLCIESDWNEINGMPEEDEAQSFRDWDEVSRFVGCSGCVLKCLRVGISEACDSLLAMLRTTMADFTDMTLLNDIGCISLSTLLPALRNDPLLLPKLEVLYLDGSNSRELCDLWHVLEFVQSHYGDGMGSLRSLYIDCEELYPKEDSWLHFSYEA